jgi:trehalose 6-phosphate synthase
VAWNGVRLQELLRERIGDAHQVVVAKREPYVQTREGDRIRWMFPASGVVTALDPLMRTCGGTWIAHGSGDADRDVADAHGRLRVPPGDESYTLRRIWLSKEEEDGYYYGFANEALWPLCHIAYTRPLFDASDWEQYRLVNQRFADAVLEEIAGRRAIVFVQDYHFALLPRYLKEARPDLVVCQFWHIPWPNREAFRICPWADEILDGLLGNDLLGFHVQHHCNNFLETVDRSIESRVDYEHFAVIRGGKRTLVRPFPIGIDPDLPYVSQERMADGGVGEVRRRLALRDEAILVGVDRLDYTKGIPERLRAVDRLLERYPEHRGRFVLVQLAAPSRTRIKRYRHLGDEVDELVDEINWRHRTERWQPIHLLKYHHPPEEISAFFRAATACVVSSLHDGMNLVAKEFVATRRDGRGVLVLSRFTGAAREMTEAVQINPYATDEFADALHEALTMPEEEQVRRMHRLRAQVAESNIYQWAGRLLSEAFRLAEVVR